MCRDMHRTYCVIHVFVLILFILLASSKERNKNSTKPDPATNTRSSTTLDYPCCWTPFEDSAMKNYSLQVQKCFLRSKLQEDQPKKRGHEHLSEGIGYNCGGEYGSPLDGAYRPDLPLPTSSVSLSSLATVLDSFRGKKVVFFGDSTMRQQFAHFACMVNPDHDISGPFTGNPYSRVVPFPTNGTIDGLNTMIIRYMCSMCQVKRKVKGRKKVVGINYTSTMKEVVLANDLVLFNIGLWHNMGSMKDFEYQNNTRRNEKNKDNFKDTLTTHVADAFREYQRLLVVGDDDNIQKKRVIGKLIWRESTPQNFATPSGLWPEEVAKFSALKNRRCESLTDSKRAINGSSIFNETIFFYNFRNQITNTYIDRHHPQLCVSRVFYPLSTSSFNIHEGRSLGDCTHLNSNALLYVNMNWILLTAVSS